MNFSTLIKSSATLILGSGMLCSFMLYSSSAEKYVKNKELIGFWHICDNDLVFERSKELGDSTFSLEFRKNGEFLVKQKINLSCSYGVYDSFVREHSGTWKRVNDSTIVTPGFSWRNVVPSSDTVYVLKRSRNSIQLKLPPLRVKILGKPFSFEN